MDSKIKNFLNAARDGQLKTIRRFIKDGININSQDESGESALHRAARNNRIRVVELLLLNSCNINIKDEQGDTPLLRAQLRGSAEVFNLLMDHGADINLKYWAGETILHWLMYPRPNFIITQIEKVIEKTDDINTQNSHRQTALHYAVREKRLNVIKLLIEKGASIYIKDEHGDTPLESISRFKKLSPNIDYTEVENFLYRYDLMCRITPILCVREFEESSLFYKDYMPLDIFRLIIRTLK